MPVLRKIMMVGCGVLAAMFGVTAHARAGLVATPQNFESFNAGDIGGQGTWTSNASSNPANDSAYVISITGGAAAADVYQGDKALKLEDNVTWGTAFADYAGTPTTTGTVTWVAKIKAGASGGGMFVQFGSGDTSNDGDNGDAINAVGFDANTGKFDFTPSNTAASDTPSYVADRWYRFRIDFDVNKGTQGQFNLIITDLTTNQDVYSASDKNFRTGYTKGTPIKEISIRASNAAKGTMYVDNLSSTVPEPGSLALLGLGGLLMFRRKRQWNV